MHATAILTYSQWLNTLDALVLSRTGLSLYMLPDLPYHPAFERDLTPDECFDTIILDYLARRAA